jgi:hypothetical protein
MASTLNASVCAILALILWTGVGMGITRRLTLGPTLSLPLAPIIGWAVQNVLSLAICLIDGFGAGTVIGTTVALVVLLALLGRAPAYATVISHPDPATSAAIRLPTWIYLAAALVALIPAAAVMPKFVQDGVILATPIFDHSKVALIDEIIRHGVPPGNPVFGNGPGAGEVAYYYLWHFGAAQLAQLTGASGWEADIASTWFTSFASLLLMSALALHFSGRRSASLLTLIFSATGSLRPILVAVFGEEPLHRVLKHSSGFAGWLFQSSWSPHHVAAAACVVVAVLLMVRLSQRPNLFTLLTLSAVVAAAFESSIWVGGITFALIGLVVGVALLIAMPVVKRRTFIVTCLTAAILAALLSSPLIAAQLDAATSRGSALPIVIRPFPVLGVLFAEPLRHILDLPAYWLVLLVIEFPLVFIPGILGFRQLFSEDNDPERRLLLLACTSTSVVCLCGSWLLLSTVGDNNDLGWRAVLPGLLLLTVTAASVTSRWLSRPIRSLAVLMLVAFLATIPDSLTNIRGNIVGHATTSAAAFAAAPDMWAAVRKYTSSDMRVANNPAYLQEVTPWPINISWALLADRRSCFAGNELAIAFASLPSGQRQEISDLFLRIFAGTGTPNDIKHIVDAYGCRAAIVTAQDGAWDHDPFAGSGLFKLAEEAKGKWRIYLSTTAGATDHSASPTGLAN